ncbi:MAG: TetR/AcrR family transcriptional regulator [Bryobacteraceae bacterium]
MEYKQSEKMAGRKQARRRRFLDVAIAQFGRLGYHAVTVPAIVAESQSSTGAFYLYFRNKEDVYVAALEEIGGRLATAINGAMLKQSRPEARMDSAVRAFVEWLAGNPAEARMLVEAAALGGRIEQARRAIIESHVRSVSIALEQVAPWFDADERTVVARCWVGSVLEAAMGWLSTAPEERMEAERVAAIVAEFNLRGAGLGGGGRTGES